MHSGVNQADFARDGFVVARALFDAEEVRLLAEITRRLLASADPHALDRHDAAGNVTRLSLRNALDDADVFSATVRCQRVAATVGALLEAEVYHYHHKVMIKDARTGGAWEWHQDYGYWYENGCLYPDMASCMVAISAHTRENGCLQVVPGSQRLGRLEHALAGDQVGARPERVAEVLRRLPVRHCELAPGDALFFHANLLHRSDANGSEEARLSLIDCFNAAHNDPYKVHHHPGYSPLELWDDDAVARVGRAQLAALQEAEA
jgi:ectoine hydroxylase-related dioxygenase (phytanoyl-CoA dioxygenase family)